MAWRAHRRLHPSRPAKRRGARQPEATGTGLGQWAIDGTSDAMPISRFIEEKMEAPSGFEPEMEVLQTSALPLGDGADRTGRDERGSAFAPAALRRDSFHSPAHGWRVKAGAGNGIRTRDFDLGKVALYH